MSYNKDTLGEEVIEVEDLNEQELHEKAQRLTKAIQEAKDVRSKDTMRRNLIEHVKDLERRLAALEAGGEDPADAEHRARMIEDLHKEAANNRPWTPDPMGDPRRAGLVPFYPHPIFPGGHDMYCRPANIWS